MRKAELANGEYYHIFNRGVDKREVFLCEKDYVRFLRSVRTFNRSDPVGSLRRAEVEPVCRIIWEKEMERCAIKV